MHQFSKVEMFVLCTPAQSEAMLDELCGIEEEIFSELGLHFRILVRTCGICSAKKQKDACCSRRGSNSRHPAHKTDALTTELRGHKT